MKSLLMFIYFAIANRVLATVLSLIFLVVGLCSPTALLNILKKLKIK